MDEKNRREPFALREEHYRILLEINNAIVSNLEKDALFKAISDQIKKLLPYDRMGVTLYNQDRDSFTIYVLETFVPLLHLKRDMEIPHHGSAIGWVLDHKRYHIRPDLSLKRIFFEDDLYFQEGLRSVLNLPLIVRGNVIGTLNLISRMPMQYQDQNVEFLSLVANQIAIAIDNTSAYEEIKSLKNRLKREVIYLREEINSESNVKEIIGQSEAVKRVLSRVGLVAKTNSLVLLTGETGTGKERFARAIHHLSERKDLPMIKVNCAAMPAGLIESELFGHEKGAFTGAISKKIGRFESADGGTIFLDEIGDLPKEAQAKVLRVLQEHEFERVGGNQTIKVDVRIIAATNRDLKTEVDENNFRADLYYRLNVFPIHLPPLRERREDIPLLVQYFVNKYMVRMGKRIEKIEKETMDRLCSYPWVGNIRELQNMIERALILSRSTTLEIEDEFLPLSNKRDLETKDYFTLVEAEKNHILKILEKTHWVVEGPRGASKILGLHPNTLRSRMQKLGINRSPAF